MSLVQGFKQVSDEDLMWQWSQTGKKKAFEELYNRYEKRMHYFFYRMLWRDSDKASDFLHDLFLKLIEKPHLYQKGKGFSSWLYSIAGNMCKNEYRKAGIHQETIFDEKIEDTWGEDETLSKSFDLNLLDEQIAKQLDLIGPENKMIFVLRFQEELPVKEIALIVNLPEGTVKSRLFYLIQKMSIKLAAYNPFKL